MNKKNQRKKVITYNLKFIDSDKYMSKVLSTLVDNLSEINKSHCEEEENKVIKTKIIKGTGKTIIHKHVKHVIQKKINCYIH